MKREINKLCYLIILMLSYWGASGQTTECLECPDITTPVATGMLDEQEAEICIYASNSIADDASAIYHAGTEVVLEEGFEALYGSIDRFYVEGCSGNFAVRQAMHQEEQEDKTKEMSPVGNGTIIYPNPVENELTITTQDNLMITAINLYSVEGKLILNNVSSQKSNTYMLDLSSVTKGVYLLSVETNDGKTEISKIVKK
ncbi:T9SS type A sorting domain-containing protein [Flavobacterium sp. D11R37]|uniref:T9SS type A sorting domain-containing protein n=1 Tax=Flavobacterium coralii TaxID=2838017 RepID=UPI001CA67C05|nr:T9SS type A sorting domain-containing protein [Flavobacterium coralii]MBY8961668.1 T9SS type A sorting domain-containing protein [Flavobacterium coralii]